MGERLSDNECYVTGEVNILLIGAGDSRHIVKTLAHCYQHLATKLNVSLVYLLFIWNNVDWL